MEKKFTLIVLIALISVYAHFASATVGVDVSQYVSVSSAQCMKRDGYTFAIVRCFRSSGSVDPNCAHTVANFWAAGFAHVDIYMFPDPKAGNAAGQISSLAKAVSSYGIKFGQLWLDIEGTQYWHSSKSSNVQFFEELANAAVKHWGHKRVGVYTSASQWEPIMGSSTAGSSYPLWYAHYDGRESFSDFSPFGGWRHPNMKQFNGDKTLCSSGVDLNWY